MADQDVLDFLEHHGIKGQRWGVVNKEKKQADREERAQKFDTKAAGFKKQIADINNNPGGNPFSRARNNKKKQELNKKMQVALSDAEAKRQGKLSHRQKNVVKGAAAAAVIVAVVGTYRMAQSGETNRIATRGKAFLSGEKGLPWKKNPLLADPNLSEDQIMQHVVKGINPDYGGLGTKMNCRRATFAYEMRRRGYEVEATKTTNGRGQSFGGLLNATRPGEKDLVGHGPLGISVHALKERTKFNKGKISETPVANLLEETAINGPGGHIWGKNAIEHDGLSMQHSIFKSLAKEPDGARGELGLGWNAGGGHSIAWEKIKGKVVLFDNQSGKKFVDDIDLTAELPSVHSAGYTRLDNIPLNTDFLQRWLKSA